MRDLPGGVLPDLGAGGLEMGGPVVVIGKLVEHPPLAFGLHRVGQIAGIFHPLLFGDQDQFGAEGLHGLTTFDRQVVGHDQDHAIALDRRRHGQRNPGIARGGLDQGVAGSDLAARLSLGDHGNRRPILDRSGRIVAFELAQNHVAATRLGFARNALQANQRRAANHRVDGGIVLSCACVHRTVANLRMPGRSEFRIESRSASMAAIRVKLRRQASTTRRVGGGGAKGT